MSGSNIKEHRIDLNVQFSKKRHPLPRLCACAKHTCNHNPNGDNPLCSPHSRSQDIDSGQLFALTIQFLEHHGIVEPLSSGQTTSRVHMASLQQELAKGDCSAPVESPSGVEMLGPQEVHLHSEFMKFVSRCLLRKPAPQRPFAKSRYVYASHPQASPVGRVGPNSATLKLQKVSKASTISPSASNPLHTGIPASKTLDLPTPGVPIPNPKQKPTGKMTRVRIPDKKPVIQKRIAQPHTMTLEEADSVREFLALTASHKQSSNRCARTLADWLLDNHAKKPIWDSRAFSIKKFIANYIKVQAETEYAFMHRFQFSRLKKADVIYSNFENFADKSYLQSSLGSSSMIQQRNNASQTRQNLPSIRHSGLVFNAHHNMITSLKKDCLQRTADDIKILFRAMRDIKAFKDLSDFILGQLCGVLKYKEYESGRTVFRQGDLGTSWYIILSGSCSVQVSNTGRVDDRTTVTTLVEGNGFGDLALVNDKPRNATIITTSYCEFAIAEKVDYNQIIRFIHERGVKEKIIFLQKIPMFSEWSAVKLRQIAQLIIWRTYAAGEVIQTQGQILTDFHIIKAGKCHLYQNLCISTTKTKVKIGELSERDYFGEEGVLFKDNKDEDGKLHVTHAKSTVIAGSDPASGVTVAAITCFDAHAKIRNEVQRNPIYEKSDSDLLLLYHEEVEIKAWERDKSRAMDRLIRERFKDPNMTVDKWNMKLNVQQPIWKG
ncbi:hypothetical protein BASA81_014995 [Batrachochytrium salamandrivorans]|nr:hypothetical protein BASA81_014995 [Batrachochytrium salamandrivorans]